MNAKGEVFWVKYHFKADQGIMNLTSDEAARIGATNSDHHHHHHHHRDLLTRRTSCPASDLRPTRCCRVACLPTATPSAIGWASTIRSDGPAERRDRHDRRAQDSDFVRASALYRLIANIAGNVGKVGRDDIIARTIGHFRAADGDYGARLEAAIKAVRAKR